MLLIIITILLFLIIVSGCFSILNVLLIAFNPSTTSNITINRTIIMIILFALFYCIRDYLIYSQL